MTLTLEDTIGVSRGDVIAHAEAPPRVTSSLHGDVVVLARRGLNPSLPVIVKQGTKRTRARITKVSALYDLDRIEKKTPPEGVLAQNDVAEVTLETQAPLVFDPFVESRKLGSFIVIDPASGDTLAAGSLR